MGASGNLTMVKWENPTDELMGLARVAAAAVARGEATPARIGFAVPNRTWGLQLQRACAAEGLPAVLTDAPLERGVRRSSIMDFRRAWIAFDWLFAVGCVEGLIPTAAALADSGELRRQQAAFEGLLQTEGRLMLSGFAVMEAPLADQIHVPYRRTKTIGGVAFACVAPSRFFDALGAARPGTVGGQQFLRDAGLN